MRGRCAGDARACAGDARLDELEFTHAAALEDSPAPDQ